MDKDSVYSLIISFLQNEGHNEIAQEIRKKIADQPQINNSSQDELSLLLGFSKLMGGDALIANRNLFSQTMKALAGPEDKSIPNIITTCTAKSTGNNLSYSFVMSPVNFGRRLLYENNDPRLNMYNIPTASKDVVRFGFIPSNSSYFLFNRIDFSSKRYSSLYKKAPAAYVNIFKTQGQLNAYGKFVKAVVRPFGDLMGNKIDQGKTRSMVLLTPVVELQCKDFALCPNEYLINEKGEINVGQHNRIWTESEIVKFVTFKRKMISIISNPKKFEERYIDMEDFIDSSYQAPQTSSTSLSTSSTPNVKQSQKREEEEEEIENDGDEDNVTQLEIEDENKDEGKDEDTNENPFEDSVEPEMEEIVDKNQEEDENEDDYENNDEEEEIAIIDEEKDNYVENNIAAVDVESGINESSEENNINNDISGDENLDTKDISEINSSDKDVVEVSQIKNKEEKLEFNYDDNVVEENEENDDIIVIPGITKKQVSTDSAVVTEEKENIYINPALTGSVVEPMEIEETEVYVEQNTQDQMNLEQEESSSKTSSNASNSNENETEEISDNTYLNRIYSNQNEEGEDLDSDCYDEQHEGNSSKYYDAENNDDEKNVEQDEEMDEQQIQTKDEEEEEEDDDDDDDSYRPNIESSRSSNDDLYPNDIDYDKRYNYILHPNRVYFRMYTANGDIFNEVSMSTLKLPVSSYVDLSDPKKAFGDDIILDSVANQNVIKHYKTIRACVDGKHDVIGMMCNHYDGKGVKRSTKNYITKQLTNKNIEDDDLLEDEIINSEDLCPEDVLNLKVLYTPYRTGSIIPFLDTRNEIKVRHNDYSGSHVNANRPLFENEYVMERFRVKELVGSATFSNCISVVDEKDENKKEYCIKIIKGEKDFIDQAFDEIQLLNLVRDLDTKGKFNCVQLRDYFYYRERLMLRFDLLGNDLYTHFEQRQSKGLENDYSLPVIRSIAKQILTSLDFIHRIGLMHADIKPENIVLVNRDWVGYTGKKSSSDYNIKVKLVDFGSSSYIFDRMHSYIQSRSYRAPEVIFAAPYDHRIDIWSFGAVLCELVTGHVLFPNHSVATIISRICSLLGPIPKSLMCSGRYVHKALTEYGVPLELSNEDEEMLNDQPGQAQMNFRDSYVFQSKQGLLEFWLYGKEIINGLSDMEILFSDFARQMLTINPVNRPTAAMLLKHPFLTMEFDETGAIKLHNKFSF